VWRASRGYVRQGLFKKDADGKSKTRIESLTPDEESGAWNVLPVDKEPIVPDGFIPGDASTIGFAIEYIKNYKPNDHGCGAIFVLCDWHPYIADNGPIFVDEQKQLFTQLARTGVNKTVIMLNPQKWDIPCELDQWVRRLEFDLPGKQERIERVDNYRTRFASNSGLAKRHPEVANMTDKDVEIVGDACSGLTRLQMENIMLMSLANNDGFDPSFILTEKRAMIRQMGFELVDPDVTFNDIGGLQPLKDWASRYRLRFTQAAFDYGFTRYPRGMFLCGVPGCGKSLVATALGAEWSMPVIQVQATNLRGSLVGESEQKTDDLLRVARASAPCILFIDEAEKLFAVTDASRDGGASSGVLALFLSFMQQDKSGVFTVFTVNRMNVLPPELVDRFEGRFFIDLPNSEERKSILDIHIGKYNRDPNDFDLDRLVHETVEFSGRGVEAAIGEALGVAFADGAREPTTDDFVNAFADIGPSRNKADIEEMRQYVVSGALREANSPDLNALDDEQVQETGLREFS